MSDLSWQMMLILFFCVLAIFAALIIVLHEIRDDKQYRKQFRITPKYSVGADVKNKTLIKKRR